MAKILIVDDDKDCIAILHNFLKIGGHEVFPMLRGEAIVEAAREIAPDLVITDLMMPGVTGGIVYHAIRKEIGPLLPIVVSSGSNLRLKLPDDPLLDYCPKPVELDTLLATVDRLIADSAARRAAGA